MVSFFYSYVLHIGMKVCYNRSNRAGNCAARKYPIKHPVWWVFLFKEKIEMGVFDDVTYQVRTQPKATYRLGDCTDLNLDSMHAQYFDTDTIFVNCDNCDARGSQVPKSRKYDFRPASRRLALALVHGAPLEYVKLVETA